MRVFITGAGGFVGRHLAAHLNSIGFTHLWGSSRAARPLDWPAYLKHVPFDLMNVAQTEAVLNELRPDCIYHLAGQASVARSWKDPEETYQANVIGQLHLLEALVRLQFKPRVLVVGSSDEYGGVEPTELPIRETNSLRPLSPYAVSKVAQDLMGHQQFRSTGLPIIRTRAFNHTGPGRPESYAVSGFAYQIAKIEAGLQSPVLMVGNLSVQRDYLDVRDVVRAYAVAMEKGVPGEVYNICSGHPVSLQDLVKILLQHTKVSIAVSPDPARMRPSDFPVMYGDGSKFRELTGWAPLIGIKQTLEDLLTDWRVRIRQAQSPSPQSPAASVRSNPPLC